VTVNLSFYPQSVGVLDTTICAGETFRFAGLEFTTPVTDEAITLPGAGAFGCDSLLSLTLNVIEPAEVVLAGDGIICANGELAFTVENTSNLPVTITLSTDPLNPEVLAPNSVTPFQRLASVGTEVRIVLAENETRCSPTITGGFTVTESNLSVGIDVMSGDGIFGVSCSGGDDGALLAVASGGQAPYRFQWSTGGTEAGLNELTAGRYSVVVTGESGCTAEALMVLNEPDAMVAALAEVPASCRDTLPRLLVRDVAGGVGPYLYRTDADAPFVPLASLPDTVTMSVGRNDFALEDANGCRLEQVFDLAGPPAQDLVISPTRVVITQGDSIELRLLTNLNVDGFRVIPGPETEVTGQSMFVGPMESTTYTFSIADDNGCTATAEAQVIIDDFIPIYAPTAFSPNGDGNNDVFRIYAKPVVLSFSNFVVFDRWGGMVFERKEAVDQQADNWGWDGRNASGEVYQPAVFVYSIDVNLQDGRVITIKGDFLLMR
jgi:gliding motility-associated-like protein